MPSYNALGINASITVADLQSTLTAALESRQGKVKQADVKRIKNVFAKGKRLFETPIAADAGECRMLRYIGDKLDMPLVMVETGQHLESHWVQSSVRRKSLSNQIPIPEIVEPVPEAATTDRTLRSDTPMIDQPQFSGLTKQSRAMQISIDWTDKAYLSGISSATGMMDIKIDVLINGILLGVTFLSRRYNQTDSREKSYSLGGIRCHRQVEKPFIYNPHEANDEQRAQTWAALSDGLRHEAEQRGVNKYGERPSSAEYMLALSSITLPQVLVNGIKAFGVVDVIITAGQGRKFGPDTSYAMECTRMIDNQYQRIPVMPPNTPVKNNSNLETTGLETIPTLLRSSLPSASDLPSSSPDIPLMQQMNALKDADHVHSQAPPQRSGNDLWDVAMAGTTSPTRVSARLRKSTNDKSNGGDSKLTPQNKKRKLQDTPILPPPKAQKFSSSPLRQVQAAGTPSEASSPQTMSAGSSNIRKPKNLRIVETSPESAVQDFQIPEVLQDSAVSVADGGNVFRHIGKERKGEFKEDSIIVGMRFIVC